MVDHAGEWDRTIVRAIAMSIQVAAGGVVYSYDAAGQLRLLVIHDKYGVWTLPKGHLDGAETEQEAACREIREETGVECVIGPLVQRICYPVQRKGVWYDKTVAYFLARAEYVTPEPSEAEGITQACWVDPEQALSLQGYTQVREVVQRALAMIPAAR